MLRCGRALAIWINGAGGAGGESEFEGVRYHNVNVGEAPWGHTLEAGAGIGP